MPYLSLSRRVPERSAVDPRVLAGLYGLIVRVPLVRAVHRLFLEQVLALDVGQGRVLDVGTGPGYVAVQLALARPGLSAVGLDLAAHMVGQAVRQARRAAVRLAGRVLWPQGDGRRLPFADATFDLVISSFALHHWQDPLQVLNEVARVLAPGGRYYVADVCREPNLLHRLFAYASIPAISLPYGSYLGWGGYYESMRAGYTRAEAEDLLRRSSLPPGRVSTVSTRFIPILTITSAGARA